jgi:hypothetical protein
MQELWGRGPLMKVDLQYMNSGLEFHPTLQQVQEQVLARFDGMASSLTEVTDHFLDAVDARTPAPPLTSDGWSGQPRFKAARCVIRHTCSLQSNSQ